MKPGLVALFSACMGPWLAQGQSFFDDFTRSSDPGPLTPWSVQSGTWTVTGGVLKAGANATSSFGYAYIANSSWTNYSVEAQIRFSTTSAYGGGIGGRLNPAFGGHYSAYICPENSPAGGKTLQIYKLQDWQSIEFTNASDQAMAVVNLPSVGTNWHSLKLAFQANQISAYYDSNLVATVRDVEPGFLGAGGIDAELFTGASSYNMFIDNVQVNPLPPVLMAANDAFFTTQNTPLTVSTPGVLANDTKATGATLTASLVNSPTKGTLNLNANGGFTYTPSNNSTGVDSFTYTVNDGSSTSSPATVAIDTAPTGTLFFDDFSRSGSGSPFAPWIIGIGEWTISGGTLQGNSTVPNNYSDAYVPMLVQDFSVQARIQMPANAWAGGLSGRVNPLTGARYVVNIYPDHSPLGPVNAMRLIKFSAWETWSFTPMALVNLPSVGTGYHTLKINFQGNQITVFYDGTQMINMADNMFDGTPAYTNGYFGAHMYMDSPSVTTFDDYRVTAISAVNHPPILPAQPDRTIPALQTLIVTNTATDSDIPANTLSYALSAAPAGAAIDSNGVITWTPTLAQDQSTNLFTTIVTDFNPGSTNNQHLSATNSFTVFVRSSPNIILDSTTLMQESCAPGNNAIDPGENVILSLALRNTGTAVTTNLTVTMLQTNGIIVTSGPQSYGQLLPNSSATSAPFSFAVNGACGSSSTAVFQLQDGASNLGIVSWPFIMGAVSTVITQGFDAVSAPALPSSWTSSATGADSPWVTQTSSSSTPPNCAFVADALNVGLSDLVSPTLLLPNGPLQLTFANNYDLEPNNSIEGFDGGVLEIKIGSGSFTDILAAGGNFVTNGYDHLISTNFSNPLAGRMAWSGTSPGFVTTIVNLPAAASGQNVQLRWRCGTDNSNGRSGWRIDAIGISGRACCANTAPILSAQPNRTIGELTQLIVTNTATDNSTSASNLTYALVSPPAGAGIDANGIISWMPSEVQGPGSYPLTTIVSDNGTPPLSATNSFLVTVAEVNSAPSLPAQPNVTVAELTQLVVTNTAIDSDIPANILTYSLLNPPAGATIDTNGLISWTPTEAQGPSTNVITTVVMDNGVPPLGGTNSFIVTVLEVNSAPSLPVQPNRTVAELNQLIVTNTASDSDLPPNVLSYTLINPPPGATITASGIISWTPTETQGPSTNIITSVVTDNGVPPLNVTNSFLVTVLEQNSAPSLPPQSDLTISELSRLFVTNTATDSDIPANTLSYALIDPPSGVTIDTNGIISWVPNKAQGPSTNVITTVVIDNGVPPLSATNSFSVTVLEVNSAPSLNDQPNVTINELTQLTITNTAYDSDIPANILTYTLIDPPPGLTIDTNGIISWIPTESQGPSTNVITTVVMDNGAPPLSATNSFTVRVLEVNSAPVLPEQPDLRVAELTPLIITNAAYDSDIPANLLTYVLIDPPSGATIDANGVIAWIPTEAQGPSVNVFTTIVTDNGVPPLSATNSFTVTVLEVNSAPSLSSQSDITINELTQLTLTNTATDSDIPANVLTYSLIDPPPGATIDTNGIISWIPGEAQGPSTNVITTVVTDDGIPPLSATNRFTVTVLEVNSAPLLPQQPDRSIIGLQALVVTNSATDSDLPQNALFYALTLAPTNATIDSQGVINWTPLMSQVPSTNVFRTVVTDDGIPPLTATNEFVVFVEEIHHGPTLPILPDLTADANAPIVITNTAADNDIPTWPLHYQLLNAPVGASIDDNGIIRWTPADSQAPSTNLVLTAVSDQPAPGDGSPISATNQFVIVIERLPAQSPSIDSISVSNQVALLGWTTVSGYAYRLQYCDDLSQANWIDSGFEVMAVGSSMLGSNDVTGVAQRFYRVLLVK